MVRHRGVRGRQRIKSGIIKNKNVGARVTRIGTRRVMVYIAAAYRRKARDSAGARTRVMVVGCSALYMRIYTLRCALHHHAVIIDGVIEWADGGLTRMATPSASPAHAHVFSRFAPLCRCTASRARLRLARPAALRRVCANVTRAASGFHFLLLLPLPVSFFRIFLFSAFAHCALPRDLR